MVSLTSTLGGLFGSAVVVKDTGITLNNATMWFNPQPGAVNSIGPGKRILSAATPTLVLRDGTPVAALGSPGGRKVVTAILQCLVNLIDYKMGPQATVSAPRVHNEGKETLIDSRFGEEAAAGLRVLGHDLEVREESFSSTYFARPNGITIDPDTGVLRGGVNQFKPAMAMGL
jgi:gamma-glutamyltranspeptidase/glutathione hydrolase